MNAIDVGYIVGSIGLFLNLIGAILIFRYGLPERVSKDGTGAILLEQIDENEIKKGKKYTTISNWGLLLLIVGFAFQIVEKIIAFTA